MTAPSPTSPPSPVKTPKSREPGSMIPLCRTRGADPEASRNFPGFLLCCPHVTQLRVTWWPVVILYQHPARDDAMPVPQGQGCSSSATATETPARAGGASFGIDSGTWLEHRVWARVPSACPRWDSTLAQRELDTSQLWSLMPIFASMQ